MGKSVRGMVQIWLVSATPLNVRRALTGSLFTDEAKSWNAVLLPASANGLPWVNTSDLYTSICRATSAWHVADMDLFSINCIYFGAPKSFKGAPVHLGRLWRVVNVAEFERSLC